MTPFAGVAEIAAEMLAKEVLAEVQCPTRLIGVDA
jgi:hypothetical protein